MGTYYDGYGNMTTLADGTYYDGNGNKIIVLTNQDNMMSWSGMTDTFKENVDTAMAYIDSYLSENENAYAISQLNDIHNTFSGNEPNYIDYHDSIGYSRMLILGDIVNVYDEKQYNDAISYMEGAYKSNRIICMGNHEYGGYEDGDTLPIEWYRPLIDESCVWWNGDDSALTYYSDDDENNVRYMVTDSLHVTRVSAGVQQISLEQIQWMASVMQSAGDKDIIIATHTPLGGFYLTTDDNKETKKITTTVTNNGTVTSVINAFQNRTSVTVNGTTYDFSPCTGKFIMYATGHWHESGYGDELGYNTFTGSCILQSGEPGMSFYIIDRTQEKIIWLVCRKTENTPSIYEYAY